LIANFYYKKKAGNKELKMRGWGAAGCTGKE
jgi:hypothetical protein